MPARIRAQDVEWRRVGDEVVILDLRRALYFSLNTSGALLWPLLVDGAAEERLVAELVSAFAIERTVAERDVAAFVTSLRERDLVDA